MSNPEKLHEYVRKLEEMDQVATPYSYPPKEYRAMFAFFRSRLRKEQQNQQNLMRLDPRISSVREEREKNNAILSLVVQILCQLANVTYLRDAKGNIYTPNEEVSEADSGSYTNI